MIVISRDFNNEIFVIFFKFFCFDKKYVFVVNMYIFNGFIGLLSFYFCVKYLYCIDSFIFIISLLIDLESWVGCLLELNCKW